MTVPLSEAVAILLPDGENWMAASWPVWAGIIDVAAWNNFGLGQFLKALIPGFLIGLKTAEKLFGHLKCHFLATNIEEQVANLSSFVIHFGIFRAKFIF